MSNRYTIDRKYTSMTIRHCPKYNVHDHYVFTCLSSCEDFEGIVEGAVICNYKYPPTESSVDESPKPRKIPGVGGPLDTPSVDGKPSGERARDTAVGPEFAIPVVDMGPLKPKKRKEKKKNGC
jgi:hypothetical protein